MSWIIGIGIPWRRGGASGPDGNPSGLILTVMSNTRIDGTFTIGSTNQDGHNVYISTDNVTFTLNQVLTGSDNTFSATGLTQATTYHFKITAFKGTTESTASTTIDATTEATSIRDGNTVAWYDFTNTSDLTLNGSNQVARWNDRLGSGHDLIQADDGLKPTYIADDGVYFDGTEMMQTAAFTFNQPLMYYAVVKMTAKTNGARIIDGIPGSYCTLYQGTSNSQVRAYAGTESSIDWNNVLNYWQIIRVKFYGGSSKLKVGNMEGIEITGNFNTRNAGGITLFCDGGGSLYKGKGLVKELIFRTGSDSDANWLSIYNYLYGKYSEFYLTVDNSAQKVDFINKQLGAIFHWNMATFQNKDWADADQALDTFAPTDLDIDNWLDACEAGGINYAYLTAQHVDGFALWPTDYHVTGYAPYSVEGTTWYSTNGQPDVVKLFVDGCNERGIKPCLYYSIWDTTFEARIGGDESVYGAEYVAKIKAQLTELLSNYGDIYAIWLDAWDLDNFSANYPEESYVDFDEIFLHVKSLQPNCLFIVPEHAGRGKFKSQITVYEVTIDGVISSGNNRPAEEIDTIRIDNTWFHNNTLDQSADALLTAAQIGTAKTTANGKKGTYCLGLSPDRSGHLPEAQVTILESL